MLPTSSSPTYAPEDQFVVGKVAYSGHADGRRLSVRHTRLLELNPELALTYGGFEGHIARLYLHPADPCELHQSNRVKIIPPRQVMETSFRDVRDVCAWPVAHHLDQICFDLPTAAVANWAEDHAIARKLMTEVQSGASVADPTLAAFGVAVAPYLEKPAPGLQFFVDHVLDGVCIALFKNRLQQSAMLRGGLAPWQERRAKELMEARIATDLSLDELARECGLSVAHFARAFRQTCGTTPHRWLVSRRVERAKHLLRNTSIPLTSVAAECGFADQAHLTNVFSRAVGTPPGAFRRFWTRMPPPGGQTIN